MKRILYIIFLLACLPQICAAQGASICLNFKNMPTKTALRFLADKMQKNFVISPSIQGKLTLKLHNVSFDQILAAILRSQELAEETIQGISYIAPVKEMTEKEKQLEQRKQKEPQKLLLIPLKYANAEELAKLLKEKNTNLLSKNSYVSADKRTNSLMIKENISELNNIKRFVNSLDKPMPQVLIKARIVNIDNNYEKTLGIKFHVKSNFTDNDTANQSNNGKIGNLQSDFSIGGTGSLGMAAFKLSSHILLDLELSALENEGKATIVSTPRLLTANQQTATIEAGEEIPYQEKAAENVSTTTFKKAVLRLQVTPQITPNKKIILRLKVNQDKRGEKDVLGVPTIDTRYIDTQILAENGQTVVLGGIYEYTKANGIIRVPFLSDLPIIGVLFKHYNMINNRRELLIFVTPKIIYLSQKQ